MFNKTKGDNIKYNKTTSTKQLLNLTCFVHRLNNIQGGNTGASGMT